MNEDQVRKIVDDELKKNYFYGSPKVPPHTHDGVDSSQINQRSLLSGIPLYGNIVFTESEVFTIQALQGVTEISFLGFAANNAGGGAATQRAVISGSAFLGKGSRMVSFAPRSAQIGPIVQTSNFMFTNETGPAFRVGLSTEYLAYTTDGSSDLVTVEITSFTKTSVTFTVTLASGWQVQGGYIFY